MHVIIPTNLNLLVVLPNAIPRVECIIQQTYLDNSSTIIARHFGSEEIETTCRGQAIIDRECELIVELKYNSHFYGMRVIKILSKGIYLYTCYDLIFTLSSFSIEATKMLSNRVHRVRGHEAIT